MKRVWFLLSFLLSFLSFHLFFTSSVLALEITKIGTTDVTGDGIGSTVTTYTYPLRSFSLYGLSVASSSVSIEIDDVTYNTTANQNGEWSTYLSNLTYDDHIILIATPAQTDFLNFTLKISSTSATPTATPTVAKISTNSATLPASGVIENTFLIAAFALLFLGFGTVIKYKD